MQSNDPLHRLIQAGKFPGEVPTGTPLNQCGERWVKALEPSGLSALFSSATGQESNQLCQLLLQAYGKIGRARLQSYLNDRLQEILTKIWDYYKKQLKPCAPTTLKSVVNGLKHQIPAGQEEMHYYQLLMPYFESLPHPLPFTRLRGWEDMRFFGLNKLEQDYERFRTCLQKLEIPKDQLPFERWLNGRCALSMCTSAGYKRFSWLDLLRQWNHPFFLPFFKALKLTLPNDPPLPAQNAAQVPWEVFFPGQLKKGLESYLGCILTVDQWSSCHQTLFSSERTCSTLFFLLEKWTRRKKQERGAFLQQGKEEVDRLIPPPRDAWMGLLEYLSLVYYTKEPLIEGQKQTLFWGFWQRSSSATLLVDSYLKSATVLLQPNNKPDAGRLVQAFACLPSIGIETHSAKALGVLNQLLRWETPRAFSDLLQSLPGHGWQAYTKILQEINQCAKGTASIPLLAACLTFNDGHPLTLEKILLRCQRFFEEPFQNFLTHTKKLSIQEIVAIFPVFEDPDAANLMFSLDTLQGAIACFRHWGGERPKTPTDERLKLFRLFLNLSDHTTLNTILTAFYPSQEVAVPDLLQALQFLTDPILKHTGTVLACITCCNEPLTVLEFCQEEGFLKLPPVLVGPLFPLLQKASSSAKKNLYAEIQEEKKVILEEGAKLSTIEHCQKCLKSTDSLTALTAFLAFRDAEPLKTLLPYCQGATLEQLASALSFFRGTTQSIQSCIKTLKTYFQHVQFQNQTTLQRRLNVLCQHSEQEIKSVFTLILTPTVPYINWTNEEHFLKTLETFFKNKSSLQDYERLFAILSSSPLSFELDLSDCRDLLGVALSVETLNRLSDSSFVSHREVHAWCKMKIPPAPFLRLFIAWHSNQLTALRRQIPYKDGATTGRYLAYLYHDPEHKLFFAHVNTETTVQAPDRLAYALTALDAIPTNLGFPVPFADALKWLSFLVKADYVPNLIVFLQKLQRRDSLTQLQLLSALEIISEMSLTREGMTALTHNFDQLKLKFTRHAPFNMTLAILVQLTQANRWRDPAQFLQSIGCQLQKNEPLPVHERCFLKAFQEFCSNDTFPQKQQKIRELASKCNQTLTAIDWIMLLANIPETIPKENPTYDEVCKLFQNRASLKAWQHGLLFLTAQPTLIPQIRAIFQLEGLLGFRLTTNELLPFSTLPFLDAKIAALIEALKAKPELPDKLLEKLQQCGKTCFSRLDYGISEENDPNAFFQHLVTDLHLRLDPLRNRQPITEAYPYHMEKDGRIFFYRKDESQQTQRGDMMLGRFNRWLPSYEGSPLFTPMMQIRPGDRYLEYLFHFFDRSPTLHVRTFRAILEIPLERLTSDHPELAHMIYYMMNQLDLQSTPSTLETYLQTHPDLAARWQKFQASDKGLLAQKISLFFEACMKGYEDVVRGKQPEPFKQDEWRQVAAAGNTYLLDKGQVSLLPQKEDQPWFSCPHDAPLKLLTFLESPTAQPSKLFALELTEDGKTGVQVWVNGKLPDRDLELSIEGRPNVAVTFCYEGVERDPALHALCPSLLEHHILLLMSAFYRN